MPAWFFPVTRAVLEEAREWQAPNLVLVGLGVIASPFIDLFFIALRGSDTGSSLDTKRSGLANGESGQNRHLERSGNDEEGGDSLCRWEVMFNRRLVGWLPEQPQPLTLRLFGLFQSLRLRFGLF